MKKLIWAIVAVLLAATTQATARNRDSEKVDANRKISFIDTRVAEELIKNVTTMDQQSLVGNWKQVIVGPTDDQIGRYDSAGIAENGSDVLTLSITATSTSFLPQSVGQQTVIQPSQDLKIYFDTIAKANEPAAASLEGDFFVIKRKENSLKCGFVNANQNNLICVRSKLAYDAKIIGFERIVTGK